jgi:hypothetical protein
MNMTKLKGLEILSYSFEPHAWRLDLSKQLEAESHITLPSGKKLSSCVLKRVYPELAHWRPQQIVAAMQQYFSDVYYTKWIEMENLREPEFLAWLYDFQEKRQTQNTACMTHMDLLSGALDKIVEKIWATYASGHFIEQAAQSHPAH